AAPVPAAYAGPAVRVLGADGVGVAGHGSPDDGARRPNLRHALCRDPVWHRVFRPPDRQFRRRVAGRQTVRGDGQLRRGLVVVRWAGLGRRSALPASARAGPRTGEDGRMKPPSSRFPGRFIRGRWRALLAYTLLGAVLAVAF